ncbi:hypothetical protein AS026_37730 [Rhizobium altiplani]|uniref:Uncharacterized protein n=1 Tax=Rhizobium altiplani TaxID=1864509 RepID=A0A109JUE3_9HYPH|nr:MULTISPECIES: hypothetical protein [Rhizobium]KWV55301.1 hypothetical protein AS026_37730 [Rhizobium altiplani]
MMHLGHVLARRSAKDHDRVGRRVHPTLSAYVLPRAFLGFDTANKTLSYHDARGMPIPIAMLLQTVKMNRVNPPDRLSQTSTRIAQGCPASEPKRSCPNRLLRPNSSGVATAEEL